MQKMFLNSGTIAISYEVLSTILKYLTILKVGCAKYP